MDTPFCTLILPYYRNPKMLAKQIENWQQMSDYVRGALTLLVVDDGSPEPAVGIPGLMQLYRITKDIPWNRNGARNLGAHVATTPWILQTDIDHLLPPEAAEALCSRANDWNPKHWYRFRRFRNGVADETRMKDALPRDAKFGEIKPHIDSYLCTRELYWKAGGYDEDYSGSLGGGSPFLRELEKVGSVRTAPPDVYLHVYTRSTCEDASDNTLSRDRSRYEKMSKAKAKAGKTKGENPLRFPWERVL
jgi:hypothetical protein